MLQWLIQLFFPPKCVLCGKFLSKNETHFCHKCHTECEDFSKSKRKITFVAQWTGVWYYSEVVKGSIHRFKFANARNYAVAYAQRLALRLQQDEMTDFDLLSWIPVSSQRKWSRGYDQGELLAQALSKELGCSCQAVLQKIRDNAPQSSISDPSKRRANVQGAYRVIDPSRIRNKRILLVDDVVTTGATASECGKTLMIGGADKVTLAAVAVADKNK